MISRWFQPTVNHYQRPALKRWAGRWWWVAFLLLITAGSLSIIDIRYLLIVFILILVVIPIGVFNVYFFSLLSPEIRNRLHYQQIELYPEKGVAIHYGFPQGDNSENTNGSTEGSIPKVGIKIPEDEYIPWNMVKTIGSSGDVWVITLKKEIGIKPDFIVVPKSALDEDITFPLYYD